MENQSIENKIKPIYTELQGYLSQSPTSDKITYQRDKTLWEQLNGCIEELNKISGDSFEKFKITNISHDTNGEYILNTEYRSKLNGLIMNLYGRYFSREFPPFSGSPATVVNQNQIQSQTTQISLLLDFQSLVDKKLYGDSKLDEKEKGFLEKIKQSLSSVKSITDVISLILSIAKNSGLTIEQITKLFT